MFIVFGLILPGNEPESTTSVADFQSTRPLIGHDFKVEVVSEKSESRFNFPEVGHKGRQACSVLISVVTQRGALVLRTAYGCPTKALRFFSCCVKYHK